MPLTDNGIDFTQAMTVCVHQDSTSITLKCVACGALLTYVFGSDPNELRAPCEHLVAPINVGSSSDPSPFSRSGDLGGSEIATGWFTDWRDAKTALEAAKMDHYEGLRDPITDDALSDEDVDAALALTIIGFDPNDRYPEWGNTSLREAYRAGWEDRDPS